MPEIELFTPSGVISGWTARLPLVGDGPTFDGPLPLADASWFPNDGRPASQPGDVVVEPDDALIVVLPEPEVRSHANWYPITVELGPYRVAGRIETLPGFDPDRALTRPGGSFVPLWGVRIELDGRTDAGTAERDYVEVNRYAVVRVTSPLVLSFHFPGATFVEAEGAPVA